jgi:DNA-binding PadR family transcriptional regulator
MSEHMFMRDPAFLIMAVLSGEDLHGYGIMKEVERLSQGDARLALGTLYGAIDRLVEKGLVEVAREEHQGRRLRRYYHLTEQGMDDLRRETDLQARVIEVAQGNLRSRAPLSARPLEAL